MSSLEGLEKQAGSRLGHQKNKTKQTRREADLQKEAAGDQETGPAAVGSRKMYMPSRVRKPGHHAGLQSGAAT